MSKTVVAIQKCQNYELNELLPVIRELCEAARMPDPKGKKVLLKPNLLSDSPPEKAITTHPVVLQALIRYLKERGAAEIFVGDSPGVQGSAFYPHHSGIGEVCEAEEVAWVDFGLDPIMTTLPYTSGHKVPLPNILTSVDLIFSVAKLKTHQLMYQTGAVKNLFGLIPGLHKSHCHLLFPHRDTFASLLAGLYATVSPHFALLDAIVSMEGPGPGGGTPRHTGLLLASCDSTAVEVSQSIIMDYQVMSIPLTRELHNLKLTSWEKVSDIGYPLLAASSLVIPDFQKIDQSKRSNLLWSMLGPRLTRYVRLRSQKREPKPLFNHTLCTGCNRCVRICPAQALILNSEHKAVCDYHNCIRCYCCHEVCPEHAITIENATEGSSG